MPPTTLVKVSCRAQGDWVRISTASSRVHLRKGLSMPARGDDNAPLPIQRQSTETTIVVLPSPVVTLLRPFRHTPASSRSRRIVMGFSRPQDRSWLHSIPLLLR